MKARDPYAPPETIEGEQKTHRVRWTVSLSVIFAAIGYAMPFCLNALANVQRLGPMPISDAFRGFSDWHWPPTVPGYLLLVPNAFAMLAFGLTSLCWLGLSSRNRRVLIFAGCLSLVLVYVYWLAFCFGIPIAPFEMQTANNSVYAALTVGPSVMILAASRLR